MPEPRTRVKEPSDYWMPAARPAFPSIVADAGAGYLTVKMPIADAIV